MMISAVLLEMLRCPVTGQKLLAADATMLAAANLLTSASNSKRDSHGSCSNTATIAAALVSADQKMLYPLQNGIPMLLKEAVVAL